MSVRQHLKGLYSPDAAVRWAAVRALGDHVSSTYSGSPGGIRELLRRLAWSLNEESGATGWGAPEAMGEILARVPELAENFPGRFTAWLSHEEVYLGNAVLDAGTLWAIGRLQGLTGETGPDVEAQIAPFLSHPDASVRGMAAWTAGQIGAVTLRADVDRLLDDREELVLLRDREIVTETVGDLAEEALATLGRG